MVVPALTFSFLIVGTILAITGMMSDHDGLVGIGAITIVASFLFGIHLAQTA